MSDMGIEEIIPGEKYRVRYQEGRGRGGRRFVVRTVYGTRDEAADFYREMNEGDPDRAPARSLKLSEFAPDYLAHCASQKAIRDKTYTVAVLVRDLGDPQLKAINTRLMEKYQAKLAAGGASPARVNRVLAVLKNMVRKAVDWEMCEPHVLEAVAKVKQRPEPRGRDRFLTAEEEARLLAACGDAPRAPWLLPIVRFALNTGARWGEIRALRWDEVDFRTGHVTFLDTKNSRSRSVPMNDTVQSVLKGLTRPLGGQERVFLGRDRKALGSVKKGFQASLKRAGIGKMRLHDLRHTFASNLVMAGVNLRTVGELLGHQSYAMTLRYAHLAPEHKAAAVRVLDKVRDVRDHQREAK